MSVFDLTTQLTCDVGTTLVYCWANVVDGGPTVHQRWANASCLLGLAVVMFSIMNSETIFHGHGMFR